jgi:hypothetical protein
MATRRKKRISGGRKPGAQSTRQRPTTRGAKKTTKGKAKKTGKKSTSKKSKKSTSKKSKEKVTHKKTAKGVARSSPAHKRVVPAVVVKRVKQPLSETWPTESEWRQSGLCAEAQADGIPCTALGRHCEICERADPKDSA